MVIGRPVIRDEGHNDTGIAGLILDILHVFGTGERNSHGTRVLVLRLIQNDRTAVRDLMFGDDPCDVGGVAALC
jgi:hypothetical protein